MANRVKYATVKMDARCMGKINAFTVHHTSIASPGALGERGKHEIRQMIVA